MVGKCLFSISSRICFSHATRYAGGMTWPYKGLLLATPQGAAFYLFKPSAPIT